MKAKKQLLGFTAASLTLWAVFMAGGAPIPFYHTYAETLGLDKGVLSLATVAYFAGTVIALLFLPRLTNYWGRKRAIYLTLAFGLAGCFLFGNVTGEWRMLAARFMQGLSCGLASSTVAAFIIDNEPRRYKGLAAVIIGSAPNIGLPLGAMGSGVFNMFSNEIGMVFVIVAALLLCCGALVFASTETITNKQSGAWRSLKPQLKITPRVKKLLPAAACAFAGTWAVGGFYQSYSAAIGIQELGVQSTFVASLTFVSFIAPGALGAALSRGRDKFLLQRFSMLAFFIAVAGVVYAIYSHSLSLFLAFNVMAGIADGAFYRQHGRNCGRYKLAGKGRRTIFNLRCCLWRRGAAKPSGKPHCPVFFAAGAYRRLRCFYRRNVYFAAAYRKAQLLLRSLKAGLEGRTWQIKF